MNCRLYVLFAVGLLMSAIAGCAGEGETKFTATTEPQVERATEAAMVEFGEQEPVPFEFAAESSPMEMEDSDAASDEPMDLQLSPPTTSSGDFIIKKNHVAKSAAVKPITRQFRQGGDVAKERMAVMSAADVETDLPPSQTTIKVFYATDRKSKYSIGSADWFNVHLGALIALGVYLFTFAGVFVARSKTFFGVLAFSSLAVFLVLGQSAMVEWQKQKRMADNGDAIYLSEIRSAGSDEMLDYGTCEVTIPPDHKIGHVDSPSLFKLEFTETPEKHVVLHRVIRNESKDEFFNDLNTAIDKSNSPQALVFVHGYNVSFDSAVKRTAQIAHDLKFDGAPICYSWSSHGALANYTKDMANADATVVALQNFLEETVRRTGNTTVHLVAHSMGNRALLQALDRIAVGSTRNQNKIFGQLVMAAPDVSVVDFKNRFAASAQELADSVTLYASSRDRALLASTEIHGHNRAGLAGDHLVVMKGIDTIDVSEIDTSLIGHSYYGDHPELIRDLRALVELAQPASNRRWLMRMTGPESVDYFRFADRNAATGQPSRR